MPVSTVWNHESDKDLLLTIINRGDVKSFDWKAISGEMTKLGYGFTQEACRQHFQKIRKARANALGTSSSPSKPAATTPKRKSNPTTKTSATKSQKTTAAHIDIADDDEDFQETPTKKMKTTKVESELLQVPMFKMESLDQENGYGRHPLIDLERDDLYEDDV